MKPNNRLSDRFRKWKLFSVLPGLMLAHAALATDPLYQNYAELDYIIPDNPPPQFDCTAFDNESDFNVTFLVFSPNPAFFETWNTLNYTNNGTMTVNAPGGGGAFGTASGAGFRFDKQTTNQIPRTMAGTFYNPGTVRCNSFLDGNDTLIFLGVGKFSTAAIGECIVSATNIMNPGTIDAGVNSLLQFNGQNVDLSRSILTIENLQSLYLGNSPGVYSTAYGFGIDTNGDWAPSVDLGATYAYSSLPYIIDLTNSTAYFKFSFPATNLNVIRAVFVQDTSPNITYNVYIESALDSGFGAGSAHVEWIGTVNDPATGESSASYLYLTDDYVLGASTNVYIYNYMPDNFSFFTSTTPLLSGPIAPGFFNVFPSGAITNPYSYFDGQLIATTAPTNVTPANPSGALTNLPGRIQITANRELDLSMAAISGQNYLSLTATNQFDGSIGAQIAAPFSDLNLGVTNGSLLVTNLLQSTIPAWNGFVAAWSTRWLTTISNSSITIDTNGVVTTNSWFVTNDWRVLLVRSSRLTPTTTPQVQDLRLHATTNLVITDVLTVLRSLFIDAQNLTLTTNGYGNGATSIEGELNLASSAILWQSALPNIRNLTNYGAITTHNQALFGSATPVYITNTTPAIAATGTLSETATNGNVATNNAVTIGTNTYTFASTIANTVRNQVKIAATVDGSMSNLIAAINRAAGSGTSYSTNTATNMQVTAGLLTSHAFTVTARAAGTNGNSIVTTTSPATTNLIWSAPALTSGVAGTTNISTIYGPYANFINHGVISDQGSTIYADYFEHSGPFSNGVGSFILQSTNTVLTNGILVAGGDVSITTGSLVASNLMVQAGRKLTLQVTNFLTDGGVSNGNIWVVGSAGISGSDSGFNLPILPGFTNRGDLLGTTVTNIAPYNKSIVNVWAGHDFGDTNGNGYTNNEAVGRLILDASTNGLFTFNGASTNNAMYVDYLELRDRATNHDVAGNFTALNIKTNMVIYFAQAVISGQSDVVKINHKNGNRLRWVTNYVGHFSGTNLVVGGTAIAVNAAMAQSSGVDSDGDGTFNATDPVPFFTSGLINLTIVTTNLPPRTEWITWNTVPNATNYVYYTTNFITWNILTNANVSSSPPGSVIHSTPTNFVLTLSNSLPVSVTVSDPTPTSRFYKVRVDTKK